MCSAVLKTVEAEKQCARCKEFWPADREFFHSCKRQPDGLSRICIACYHELPCVQKRKVQREAATECNCGPIAENE